MNPISSFLCLVGAMAWTLTGLAFILTFNFDKRRPAPFQWIILAPGVTFFLVVVGITYVTMWLFVPDHASNPQKIIMTRNSSSVADAIRAQADEMVRQAAELDAQADSYRGCSFYGQPPGAYERKLATSLRQGAAALLASVRGVPASLDQS